MNNPNAEFYWGTVRGERVESYSGTLDTVSEDFDIERYETALVERYGAPMEFRVVHFEKVAAITGYDPRNMPQIPAVMMCVAKVRDLPEDEPVLGSPLHF
jgi:hypothetical protein